MSVPVSVTRLAYAASALVLLSIGSVVVAGPASADVPEGWPATDPVEPLHLIAVLVGIPLLIAVLIALAIYVPAMVRGEDVTPGGATPEDQWLGGPRTPAGELTSPGTEDTQAGGAGARW